MLAGTLKVIAQYEMNLAAQRHDVGPPPWPGVLAKRLAVIIGISQESSDDHEDIVSSWQTISAECLSRGGCFFRKPGLQ